MHAVTGAIQSGGYLAVFGLMVLTSACIPIPSEVIMPFAGYLVYTGALSFTAAALAGVAGDAAGAAAAYAVGSAGGRPLVERYGRFVLLRRKDLDSADRFFTKYGEAAVFFGRLMPIVRTFISLPAGISRMKFPRFLAYSFLGSIPWCFMLTYVGMKLGQNWASVRSRLHGADRVVEVLLVFGFIVFVWRHLKPEKERNATVE